MEQKQSEAEQSGSSPVPPPTIVVFRFTAITEQDEALLQAWQGGFGERSAFIVN
jgi:hypothetical protein